MEDGKLIHSETEESLVEHTNEYASLESGDILALPENIETGVDLDSQPFPTDKEMKNQVTQNYINSLIKTVNKVVLSL